MNVVVCNILYSIYMTLIKALDSNLTEHMQPMAGGTAISHPSFQPSIDAVLYGRGTDYIRNDPDGKHMRLDAHTVIK